MQSFELHVLGQLSLAADFLEFAALDKIWQAGFVSACLLWVPDCGACADRSYGPSLAREEIVQWRPSAQMYPAAPYACDSTLLIPQPPIDELFAFAW